MDTHNLCHIFEEPSRITTSSTSCVDNIFVNYELSDCESGILIPHFSDYSAQLLNIITENPENNEFTFTRISSISNTNLFVDLINRVDWRHLKRLGAEDGYNWFHDTVVRYVEYSSSERKINVETILRSFYEELKTNNKQHLENSARKRDLEQCRK
ncbi:hypothetical protein HHI36_004560 [Cryptolaemus montrouzieri]|uniref:Uncharacterized protein n=1 Tax=Cryptolaemus montrouzieri TaxID=559131 RepID=A0ABD2NS06_9CUCU